MTEKQLREDERLVTVDDYVNEIQRVAEIARDSEDEVNYYDKALNLLSKCLYLKYKYIVRYSAPYRRRQGIFSQIRDWFAERRERKVLERAECEDEQDEDEKVEEKIPPSTAPATSQIEVLDKAPVKQITEGEECQENSQE